MFIFDLLLAFVLALIVVAIVVPSGRYRSHDGTSPALFFFPLLLVLIWALGAWLTPLGPPVAGIYWLSFVLPTLFLLLLLLALSSRSGPPRRKGDVVPDNAEQEAAAGTIIACSVFFWALLIAALIAVAVRYF